MRRKIHFGCTVSRCSGSPAVLKNILNKKRKVKHVALNWKTSVIILQVFVFDKTYYLFLRDSALVHPECASSGHPRVYLFKQYCFVSCFLTMALNRTKLKYGTMKLKAYKNLMWMIELEAIYLLGPIGSLLLHPESAPWVYNRLHFLWCD